MPVTERHDADAPTFPPWLVRLQADAVTTEAHTLQALVRLQPVDLKDIAGVAWLRNPEARREKPGILARVPMWRHAYRATHTVEMLYRATRTVEALAQDMSRIAAPLAANAELAEALRPVRDEVARTLRYAESLCARLDAMPWIVRRIAGRRAARLRDRVEDVVETLELVIDDDLRQDLAARLDEPLPPSREDWRETLARL